MNFQTMTAKQLAEKLDGREYRHEITPEEEREAENNGLVVVTGYSDDGVEFYGAISDEVGAYNGTEIYLTKEGILKCPDCEAETYNCPYFNHEMEKAKKITAVRCKNGCYDFAWMFDTDIPHETFRILEDGEHFCIGIVFSIDDLGKGA